MDLDQPPAAAAGQQLDTDVVGVGHDPANEVFDGVGDDDAHASSFGVGSGLTPRDGLGHGLTVVGEVFLASLGLRLSGPGASRRGGLVLGFGLLLGLLRSFFAAFFFGVVASATGSLSAAASAALNKSRLLGLGSATFRVPSAPGRPLNFCQSPVIQDRGYRLSGLRRRRASTGRGRESR